MRQRSGIQRFLAELRRRHVPQTAAVYMVAAWAAIQFADVVVPNLGWSDSIITAVIVAALVGLPVVLILAWVFDWDRAGIHRVDAAADPASAGRPDRLPPETSASWVTAVSVLVVGIASALAVAVVLEHADGGSAPEEARADQARGDQARAEGDAVRRAAGDDGDPGAPLVPGMPPGIVSPEFDDSMEALLARFSDLGRLEGLAELRRLGEQLGPDRSLLIGSPPAWIRLGGVHPLAPGDTLRIHGVARDSVGVVSIAVNGEVVAESEGADATLPFQAAIVGTGSRGVRTVEVAIETADGRRIVRQYRIQQVPGG